MALEKILTWILLFLVPGLALSFGGVEQWSRAALEIIVFSILCVWGLGRFLAIRRGEVSTATIPSPLLIFVPVIILILIQTLRLPGEILGLVSPALFIIKKSAALDAIGFPTGISIDRPASLDAFLLVSVYFLIVLFFSIEGRNPRDATRYLLLLCVMAFMISLFGIIQHFSWNEKIYWIMTIPPGKRPFGPFFNRNHFAAFINLVLIPAMAISISQFSIDGRRGISIPDRHRYYMTIFMSSLMMLAVVISLSRGGMLALLFSIFTMIILNKAAGSRHLGVLVVVILTASLLMMVGAEIIIDRMKTLGDVTEDLSFFYRLRAWGTSLEIFRDFPVFGTGAGTFGKIFPMYRPAGMPKPFDHAHNDYLQALIEMGVVGIIPVLASVVMLLAMTFKNIINSDDIHHRYIRTGIFCGLLTILIHSLADFNLRIPAVAYLFSIMAGLSLSSAAGGRRDIRITGRGYLVLATFSLLLLMTSLLCTFSKVFPMVSPGTEMPTLFMDSRHLLDEGDRSYNDGKYSDAVKYYLESIQASPLDALAWAKLGMANEMLGNMRDAKKNLYTAVRLNPYNPSFRYNLGRLKLNNKDREGIADLKVAAERGGEWLISSVELMISLGLSDDLIIDLADGDGYRLRTIGRSLDTAGRTDGARSAYKIMVLSDPQNESFIDGYAYFLISHKSVNDLVNIPQIYNVVPDRAKYWVAEGFIRKGEIEKSIEILSDLSAKDHRVEYIEKLATAYLYKKEYKKAIEQSTEALKINGRSHAGFSVASAAYEAGKNWIKLAEILQKAVITYNRDLVFRVRLATAYESLGLRINAIRELQQALDIAPDDLHVRLRLGDIYVAENRWDDALEQFQTALSMDQSNEAIMSRISNLMKSRL